LGIRILSSSHDEGNKTLKDLFYYVPGFTPADIQRNSDSFWPLSFSKAQKKAEEVRKEAGFDYPDDFNPSEWIPEYTPEDLLDASDGDPDLALHIAKAQVWRSMRIDKEFDEFLQKEILNRTVMVKSPEIISALDPDEHDHGHDHHAHDDLDLAHAEPEHDHEPGQEITLSVFNRDNQIVKFTARTGQTLFEAMFENGIEASYDVACFGPLASQDEDGLAPGPDCAICHVWVSEEFGKSLPEPSEEEEHNFNLMYEKHNYRYGSSRLACQIKLGPEHNNATFALPPPVLPL